MRTGHILIALTASSIAVPRPADAQEARVPRASQHGIVSQTLTGVTITVEYDRPSARGRDLFGGIVHWGEFWTPGANWATTIEADDSFTINGNELAAGKYSIWMIPQEDEWTVILNDEERVFHTQRPDPEQEVARFTVASRPTESYLDALTFFFPRVRPASATLAMQWGDTQIPMTVEVPPYPHVTLTRAEMAVYTGEYSREDGGTLTITEEDGVLVGRGLGRIATHLIPKGDHTFETGRFIDGELAVVNSTERSLVFRVEADRAVAYTLYLNGEAQESGSRL